MMLLSFTDVIDINDINVVIVDTDIIDISLCC